MAFFALVVPSEKIYMAKEVKLAAIKYDDKSQGQPELAAVFADLKKILSQFVKGSYTVKDDLPGNYSVYYTKPAVIGGRTYPELPLASILVQKGYVGLYFFCIYTDPELKKSLPASLLKQLKGKTCFHIRKADEAFLKEVRDAIDKGYRHYVSKGWA